MPKKPIDQHIADIKAACIQLDALLCSAEADGYEVYDGANGLGRGLNFSLMVPVGPERDAE